MEIPTATRTSHFLTAIFQRARSGFSPLPFFLISPLPILQELSLLFSFFFTFLVFIPLPFLRCSVRYFLWPCKIMFHVAINVRFSSTPLPCPMNFLHFSVPGISLRLPLPATCMPLNKKCINEIKGRPTYIAHTQCCTQLSLRPFRLRSVDVSARISPFIFPH